MKPQRPDNDVRAAQADSPVALLLIDLLADPCSALYSALRVSDLFCVRLTCREAWRRIDHEVLTKRDLWSTALESPCGQVHVPMLRWCMRQQVCLEDSVTELLGATGNMSLIEELLEGYGTDILYPLAFGAATRSSNAVAVSTLLARLDRNDQRRLRSPANTATGVSGVGSVEVAEVLYGNPTALIFDYIVPALTSGHLRFVQWAYSESTPKEHDSMEAVTYAAESGSVDLVRWLVEEQDCQISSGALLSAARAGQLTMLQWLYRQIAGDLQPTVVPAARSGQRHLLEWLVEQGCQMTEMAVYTAASASSTSALAWLLDRGCPYDEGMLVEKACRNSYEAVKFLAETKGMQYDPELSGLTQRDSTYPVRIEMLLHQSCGRPLSAGFLGIASSHSIACVRYGLVHGIPLGSLGDYGKITLQHMLETNKCAMVNETVEHYLVSGKLTDEFRLLLDLSMPASYALTDEMLQVLSRFGYEVPKELVRMNMALRLVTSVHRFLFS